MKTRHLKPYVRRGRGREYATSRRTATQLAACSLSGRRYYVLVQRGHARLVLAVAFRKRELMASPLMVAAGLTTFRRWARNVQRLALMTGGQVHEC